MNLIRSEKSAKISFPNPMMEKGTPTHLFPIYFKNPIAIFNMLVVDYWVQTTEAMWLK